MSEKAKIREFIIENFVVDEGEGDIGDDDSLLEKGIVDSMGMLELIAFVEETYDVEVEDDEVVPDNFDSVSKLAAYIGKKMARQPV